MLDIGFWELILVAVIALIVLGPERLPVVARTAGRLVARVRRQLRELTGELDGDDSIRELKRELNYLREQIENDTNVDEIKSQLGRTRDEINGQADSISKSAENDFRYDDDAAETATGSDHNSDGPDINFDGDKSVFESGDTQHVAAGNDTYADNPTDPATDVRPDGSESGGAQAGHTREAQAGGQAARDRYTQQETVE